MDCALCNTLRIAGLRAAERRTLLDQPRLNRRPQAACSETAFLLLMLGLPPQTLLRGSTPEPRKGLRPLTPFSLRAALSYCEINLPRHRHPPAAPLCFLPKPRMFSRSRVYSVNMDKEGIA